jgi:hypothetical protein
MIETHGRHLQFVQDIPIEEQDDKYTYSIMRSLLEILENVIIKKHGQLIKATDKLKLVRFLLRLQCGESI